MIGLDTNVVVRHLVQDDPIQSKVATGLFESLTPSEPGFLTTVVLVEIYWVLTRGYGISSDDVAAVLEVLADSGDIVVQDQSNARAALRDLRKGADFADALISHTCRASGCSAVFSFDRKSQRLLRFQAPDEA